MLRRETISIFDITYAETLCTYLSSRAMAAAGVVYDDDTSDSDDEALETFKDKIGSMKPAEDDLPAESGSEEEGSSGSESEVEMSGDSSEEDSDTPLEAPAEITNEVKARLARLQQQVRAVKDEEDDSGGSEDDNKSDEDVDHEENKTKKVVSKNVASQESSNKATDGEAVKNSDDSEENFDEEEARRARYRQKLGKMNIEEIQKLKEKLGLKLFNQKLKGTGRARKTEFKRENKNRPRELSSKKTVSR